MVPATLHQIIGPKTNEVINKCLLSWKILEDNGFKFKYWDDDMLESFITDNYSFAIDPFLNARNHAEASDIARYLIIFHYGGIYMDWDIQLLDVKKFTDICYHEKYGFLLRDPPNQTLASEAFSAIKGEKFLLDVVKDIVKVYFDGLRDSMNTPHYSGPYRMRDALINRNTRQKIFSVKEVFAYDYSEIRNMPKRRITQPLIHYWIHSWL